MIDEVSPQVRAFITQFKSQRSIQTFDSVRTQSQQSMPSFHKTQSNNATEFTDNIVNRVIEELNKKQLQESSNQQQIKNFQLDLRQLSSQKKQLNYEQNTVQLQINPQSSKQSEDDDDSFIRYMQQKLRKNSQSEIDNYSQINIENSYIKPKCYTMSKNSFNQRQEEFQRNKENKLMKQRKQKEQKQVEEENIYRNYQTQRRLQNCDSKSNSIHNKLYQDACNRNNRRTLNEIKVNQQRNVLKQISTDRRIMNNLAKLDIPQDVLNSILNI